MTVIGLPLYHHSPRVRAMARRNLEDATAAWKKRCADLDAIDARIASILTSRAAVVTLAELRGARAKRARIVKSLAWWSAALDRAMQAFSEAHVRCCDLLRPPGSL